MVESVEPLNAVPECEVAAEEARRAGRARRCRKPCAVHGPMPETSVSAASTSSSVICGQRLVAQASVDEPLRECPQRRALAGGETGLRAAPADRPRAARPATADVHRIAARREPGSFASPDGELLAGDLEDERPKGVEPGKLVDPCARVEVGMRVDAARGQGRRPRNSRRGIGAATVCAEELACTISGDRRARRAARGVQMVATGSRTGRLAIRGGPGSRSRGRGGSTPSPRTSCSR